MLPPCYTPQLFSTDHDFLFDITQLMSSMIAYSLTLNFYTTSGMTTFLCSPRNVHSEKNTLSKYSKQTFLLPAEQIIWCFCVWTCEEKRTRCTLIGTNSTSGTQPENQNRRKVVKVSSYLKNKAKQKKTLRRAQPEQESRQELTRVWMAGLPKEAACGRQSNCTVTWQVYDCWVNACQGGHILYSYSTGINLCKL